MENEIIVDEVQNVLTEEEVIVDEEETIDEIQEIVKEDEVETHEILTEEETKKQKIPELNYEYCQEMGLNQKVINRFWKKIKLPDNLIDGCWNWTAYKDKKGYGRFGFAGSMYRAHRFSHMIFKGEIGEGLCIRHKYDNPGCVNPHHLLVGTPQDNMDDRNSQNRQAKGEDQGLSKLTETEVDTILEQLLQKVSVKSLAIQYNVSQTNIYKISIGKIWKHCYNKLSVAQQWQLKNINRLFPDDTKEIRELYRTTTITQVNLATKFKVSVPTIVKVIKRIPPYDY